ncbi:Aspartic protease 10 [Meloidogyne graminicola]|uniref:Aspartic protease 10 n=2 Tax=Meloidogyne graminicola TaxID=189291 RepID=A0A8S9Z618_9BILA|nr:Aspartic protease 10 [Meloidogyne graminicola]
MIKVQIGNPPQNFNVLLSTGSADFWVLHSSIKTNKQRFFSQKSSTYSNSSKFMVIGNVEGFVGVDTVQFAGLKLNKIEFNQVDIIDSITLKQPFEGALGLAYPSLSKSKTVSPVMTAIQQNLFANKMFTLYLKGGYGPNAENKYGGRVTFGDFDFQNCGKIMGWTNISPQIHYQFQIDSISFNGKVVSGKTQAIAESSTSVIMGDKAVTDNLAKQVGGVWDENEGLYILLVIKIILQ